jgi:hypothetical protein
MPAVDRGGPEGLTVRRDGKLSDGMVIVASVRARLLGMQLLEVDANVTVSPQRPGLSVEPLPQGDRQRTRAAPSPNGASIGDGLDAATRSLEASTRELAAARERMP